MMRFADPWWLALAPLAVLLVLRRSRMKARPTAVFSSLDALRRLPKTYAERLKPLLPILEILGLVSLAVALARPQAGRVEVDRTTEGVAIEMVLDRSYSMRADDLDDDRFDRKVVRRIDVVKDVVRDFVDETGELPGRPNDLVGLVTFCGFVQTHVPLTLDHDAFLAVLEGVDLPELRRDARGQVDERDAEVTATALGDGLVTGVSRLEEARAKSKVIILLSDGRGNLGVASPEAGAEAAKAAGIRIYSIAIGAIGGAELDEATLKKLAEDTGGRYFNATTADGVRRIWGEIDALERSEITASRSTRWKDHFALFLVAGLGLLVLHRLLEDTRFRTLP